MEKTKNILLIDDDQLIHISCEMIFYNTNYKLTSIVSAAEAINYPKYKSNYPKPDLILVDYMLENITGIDVVEEIRKYSCFNGRPIIIFTGYKNQISEKRCLLKELDICYVMAKPVTKEEMLVTLGKYLK